MSFGYWGKILTVNLTEGTIKERPLGDKLYRDFIGGAGLGVRLLFEGQPGGADPLDRTTSWA